MNKYYLSASIICADLANLRSELESLEKAEIDYIHFDMMDGLFVPRFGLYPEFLKTIKSITKTPVDVHMMTVDPEPYLSQLVEAGADIIAVHAEGNNNLHRTIKKIKDLGIKAGVVLNPSTPLSVLDYLLDDLDLVELMGINPGIVGHKLIPKTLDKIRDLKKKLAYHPQVVIEVDGGVTPESAPEMIRAGATILVCGTATIFRPDSKVVEKVISFRQLLEEKLK